ncbi:MAG TPA: insulinase family protein [Sutterella sp.]|nr:insulinase family protein [Sutterella sp.]
MTLKTLMMTTLVTASLAAGAASVKPLASVEGIHSYQLDNGLQVVLFADQSKPTATVNMTYLVGSRMENYGETGMAHLLEHLMFKGSKNYPEPTKEFTRRGFRMNGSTWVDRTNYFVSFTANDDNMRWALGWSADAMVNSFIAKKDLDTEMTVVRNEYEMGENRPVSVMLKRMQSVLFDWHAYGRSTIGARSDIENVPIENLQAFYRKWYQPDNAVLTVSGKFDENKVLGWIGELFGPIPRPERALPREWTIEPVSDGPREFQIRRKGEMQLVAVGYRIPSALADDSSAVETAIDILSESPRGRLYKALVESGKASQVFGWPMGTLDPGFVMFGALVAKGADLEPVKQILIDTIETAFAKNPATEQEVALNLQQQATEFERTLSDPEGFAVDLSEYIALGDWRLFFVDRDKTAAVKPADVDKAAATYFVRDNRVVGMFIPDDNPKAAPAMTRPNARDVIASAKFRAEGDVAEAFDTSHDNIDKRTERLEINGVKVALLAKRNRGRTVTVASDFRYGNVKTLTGHGVMDVLVGPMLTRGTDTKSRDQISELMTNLRMQGDALSFQTDHDHVVAALELMGELTTKSTFPPKQVKQLIHQVKTSIQSKTDDPGKLARDAVNRHFRTYPEGDPRSAMTMDEMLAALSTVTRDEIAKWFADVIGTDHGQIVVVGDFDVQAVKEVLRKVLAAKKPADPASAWERFSSEYRPVSAGRIVIDTPEKQNAFLTARVDFAGKRSDKEAAAYVVADWIIGGGTGLSNRLVDRLRQKEGLSYGVYSFVTLPNFGNRARWSASAIVAPQNLERAEQCMKEEIARILKDGVTQKELDEAKKGIIQSRAVNRAQDDYLAQSWLVFLDTGKSFAYSKEFENDIQALTVAQVNAALRKMLANGLTYVLAGDLKKSKGLQATK